VVTNAYAVIHNADPEKYQWGEILEILPPDPRITEDFAGISSFTTKLTDESPIGDLVRPNLGYLRMKQETIIRMRNNTANQN
jgi:hypothetical protein